MPLTFFRIKIGMRVKCNFTEPCIGGGIRRDKTAIVISWNISGTIKVKWDDGFTGNTLWASPIFFDEIEVPLRTLNVKDIKVGARVYHIARGEWASIYNVLDNNAFQIIWAGQSLPAWMVYYREHCIRFQVEDNSKRKRKIKKDIPDIPIDTSMPLLQAGYLQDRMRKKFK